MAFVTCCQVEWDGHALPIPPMRYKTNGTLRQTQFFKIRLAPEPEWPVGRKGKALAGTWTNHAARCGADGILILDGDVAIDPVHFQQMMDAIGEDPQAVWTAPVRIWPCSGGRPDWVWAHWDERASQEIDENPVWFSFSFTYLPAALWRAAIKAGLAGWTYPKVDQNMSRTAQRLGLRVRVVPECFPVHLHW